MHPLGRSSERDSSSRRSKPKRALADEPCAAPGRYSEGGDDTVGNPHSAQISQFAVFERILLSKLGKQISIEQFEPTVSQSTVSSPPLNYGPRAGGGWGPRGGWAAGRRHPARRPGSLRSQVSMFLRGVCMFAESGQQHERGKQMCLPPAETTNVRPPPVLSSLFPAHLPKAWPSTAACREGDEESLGRVGILGFGAAFHGRGFWSRGVLLSSGAAGAQHSLVLQLRGEGGGTPQLSLWSRCNRDVDPWRVASLHSDPETPQIKYGPVHLSGNFSPKMLKP